MGSRSLVGIATRRAHVHSTPPPWNKALWPRQRPTQQGHKRSHVNLASIRGDSCNVRLLYSPRSLTCNVHTYACTHLKRGAAAPEAFTDHQGVPFTWTGTATAREYMCALCGDSVCKQYCYLLLGVPQVEGAPGGESTISYLLHCSWGLDHRPFTYPKKTVRESLAVQLACCPSATSLGFLLARHKLLLFWSACRQGIRW